jgi:hypothetical protein
VLTIPKKPYAYLRSNMYVEEEWYGLASITGSPLGETPGGKGADAGRHYYP